MGRGPAPLWKRRLEPILDHELQAVIAHANGKFDPGTGKYGTLHHTGCESNERAKEIKRALFRSARYVGVSVSTKIVKTGSNYTVEFTVYNKDHAKAYIAKQSGGDPSKLAYNPHVKNVKEPDA